MICDSVGDRYSIASTPLGGDPCGADPSDTTDYSSTDSNGITSNLEHLLIVPAAIDEQRSTTKYGVDLACPAASSLPKCRTTATAFCIGLPTLRRPPFRSSILTTPTSSPPTPTRTPAADD